MGITMALPGKGGETVCWALGAGSSLWLPVGHAQRLIYYAAGCRGSLFLRGHKIITRPTAKFIFQSLKKKPLRVKCVKEIQMHLRDRCRGGVFTPDYRLAWRRGIQFVLAYPKTNDCLMSCPLSIIIEWKLP